MKVKGLDGKERNWNLAGCRPLNNDKRQRSQYHKKARLLLEQTFPAEQRLEEVFLPGSDGLMADFVLPGRKLIVEVHGKQHYSFVGFFHRTKMKFFEAQQNDQNKREWCELNGFRLVELPYSETEDEWTRRLVG